MRIELNNREKSLEYFSKIREYIKQNELFCTKYIDLGVKVIRVLCYTQEVVPIMEKQLTYTLRDNADKYDATIVVWKEKDVESLAISLGDTFDPKKNLKLRLGMIYNQKRYPSFEIVDTSYSLSSPIMFIDTHNNVIEIYDYENQTAYYGVKNFEPEEFIKLGHIFIQQLNSLIKSSTSNIAHGAIVGFNDNGVLFCARGQRGKSTLTVHSMMNGFEYVSDDYQILSKRNGTLYSYPIYSIITLSPTMYNELYDDLKGKFVSNNGRHDKYVINISPYHNQFRTDYPIKLCIFPEIVSKPDTEIYLCSAEEKGRAIVQLIQSTLAQMRDLNNKTKKKKMFEMVKDLPFYKLDLCRNIARNTENLRNFLNKYQPTSKDIINTNRIIVDITFDLANIIDTETYTIYTMNKFATNVYQNLLNGFSEKEIWDRLQQLTNKNILLAKEFEVFMAIIKNRGFLIPQISKSAELFIDLNFAAECDFRLSITEFAEHENIELIKPNKGV